MRVIDSPRAFAKARTCCVSVPSRGMRVIDLGTSRRSTIVEHGVSVPSRGMRVIDKSALYDDMTGYVDEVSVPSRGMRVIDKDKLMKTAYYHDKVSVPSRGLRVIDI